MSPELQRNLGEVLALLPLPSSDSTVVSVDRGGWGYSVVLRLVGETDEVELSGPEGRHAATVRRVRVGEPVDLADGRGTRAHCTVLSVGHDVVRLRVDERALEPEPAPRVVLVQALAKGDRISIDLPAFGLVPARIAWCRDGMIGGLFDAVVDIRHCVGRPGGSSVFAARRAGNGSPD